MAKGPNNFIQSTMQNMFFKKWKSGVIKNVKSEPHTEQWWNDMTDSLSFVPEDQRATIINGFVGLGVAF